MACELIQLRLSDPRGKVEREIIVSESTTMFNLHRILQFSIKPRQADSVIDCKPYTFTNVASGKKVARLKTTRFYHANGTADMQVGDRYAYEAETGLKAGGKESYLVEVVETCGGGSRYYVPRCISSNTDMKPINQKLLARKFTKHGAMTPKAAPKVWCSSSTSYNELMSGHLASMQEPLGGWN